MTDNIAPSKRTRSEYDIEEQEQTSPYYLLAGHVYGQGRFGIQQQGGAEDYGNTVGGQQGLLVEQPSMLDPAIQYGVNRHEPNEPYQHEAYQQEPSRYESYQNGPYQRGPYEQEPSRHESYQNGPYQRGLYEQEPYKLGQYQQRPYQQQPYQQEPYQQQPYQQEPYQQEPYQQQPNQQEPYQRELNRLEFNQQTGNLAYGTKFYPHKQRFTDLVRGGLIRVGDEIEYTGGNKNDHWNIFVSSINGNSSLNISVTFLSTPTSTSAPTPTPVQTTYHEKIESVNALENTLLERAGIDTSKLSKRRLHVWPKFSIVRNGERCGTLPELRIFLGKKRLEGDKAVLEKMHYHQRRWQKRPGLVGAGTGTGTEGAESSSQAN